MAAQTPVKVAAGGFSVPLDLLKHFKTDVRTIPNHLPTNGYIIFDHAMLSAVLRGKDEAARVELAKAIDKFAEAGGGFLMIER
jgi:hypothetical protein